MKAVRVAFVGVAAGCALTFVSPAVADEPSPALGDLFSHVADTFTTPPASHDSADRDRGSARERRTRRIAVELRQQRLKMERQATREGRASTTVGSLAESWYVMAPEALEQLGAEPHGAILDLTCTLPVGCVGSPVPLDTLLNIENGLHVIELVGNTVAQAYVLPDLASVPIGATAISGTLHLPLLTSPDAGNVNVETAKLQGCLVTGLIVDGVKAGSTGAPAYDCSAGSSPLTYVAERDEFVVDLRKLLATWTPGGLSPGVAIVPRGGGGLMDTWHVNFALTRGKSGPSATVTYEEPEPADAPTTEPESVDPPAPIDTTLPPVALPELVVPMTEVPPSGILPDAVPEAAPIAPTISPVALFNQPWYRYPGMVFLPIILLLGMATLGRAMLTPLERRRRSRR